MKIYIAGKVTAARRLREERQTLRKLGHDCKSSWMDLAIPYPENFGAAAFDTATEANRDLAEIEECELLIIDTQDMSETGGREFEMGFAFAKDKVIYRVGPRRHIFHDNVSAVFENWRQVHAELEGVE